MIWLLPRPLYPRCTLPVSKLDQRKHKKTEKERQLADERGGGEGGEGAKSYEGEKAWFSLNHSILYKPTHLDPPPIPSGFLFTLFICALHLFATLSLEDPQYSVTVTH
jgi:hypothetical protein